MNTLANILAGVDGDPYRNNPSLISMMQQQMAAQNATQGMGQQPGGPSGNDLQAQPLSPQVLQMLMQRMGQQPSPLMPGQPSGLGSLGQMAPPQDGFY